MNRLRKKSEKWFRGITQVVESLPTKCEAMSSNTNGIKKKNYEKQSHSQQCQKIKYLIINLTKVVKGN
jgi:hypothetical protein